MAALAFFGYLFLGIGPGVVFWLFFIAPKSFLVLLSITRWGRRPRSQAQLKQLAQLAVC